MADFDYSSNRGGAGFGLFLLGAILLLGVIALLVAPGGSGDDTVAIPADPAPITPATPAE